MPIALINPKGLTKPEKDLHEETKTENKKPPP
jgi:hypothetical protein